MHSNSALSMAPNNAFLFPGSLSDQWAAQHSLVASQNIIQNDSSHISFDTPQLNLYTTSPPSHSGPPIQPNRILPVNGARVHPGLTQLGQPVFSNPAAGYSTPYIAIPHQQQQQQAAHHQLSTHFAYGLSRMANGVSPGSISITAPLQQIDSTIYQSGPQMHTSNYIPMRLPHTNTLTPASYPTYDSLKHFGALPNAPNHRNHRQNTSKTNLYISGLSENDTADSLKALVGKIPVKSCMVMQNMDGKCRGSGFIDCATEQDAELAKKAILKFALGTGRNIVPKMAFESKKDPLNLYVRNLPQIDFTNEELEELFKEFGNVTSVKLQDKMGKRTGVGFVRFASSDHAATAISEINKREIKLKGNLLPVTCKQADLTDPRKKAAVAAVAVAAAGASGTAFIGNGHNNIHQPTNLASQTTQPHMHSHLSGHPASPLSCQTVGLNHHPSLHGGHPATHMQHPAAAAVAAAAAAAAVAGMGHVTQAPGPHTSVSSVSTGPGMVGQLQLAAAAASGMHPGRPPVITSATGQSPLQNHHPPHPQHQLQANSSHHLTPLSHQQQQSYQSQQHQLGQHHRSSLSQMQPAQTIPQLPQNAICQATPSVSAAIYLGHQSGSSLLSSSLSGVLPPPQGPPELVGTAPSPSAAPCSTPLSHHISGQSGGVYISPPGSHDGLVKATNAVIAGASNATVYALAVAAAQAQQHQQLSPQSQQQQPSHAHPLLANPYPRGPICPQPMASNHLNSTSHSPTLANANSISANPAVSLAGLLAPGTAQHSVPSLTYTTHIPDSSGLLSLSNNAGTATSSAQPSILLTNGPGQMTCVGQIASATSETPVPVFSMATGIYTTSNPVSGLPIQTFPTGYLVGNAPNSIQIQHPGQFEVIDMNYLGPSPASTVAEQLIASSEAVALSNDLSHINLLPIVGSTSISSQLGPSRTQTSVTLSADSLVDHSSTLESFSSAGAPSVANITPVMLYAGQLEQISGSTINSTELVSSVNGTTMMEGPGRRNRIGAGHIPQTSHDSSGGPQYPITPCSSEPGRRIETHEPDDAGESRKQSIPPTSIRSNKKKGSGAILLDKEDHLDVHSSTMTGVVGGNKKRGGSNGVRDVGLNSLGSRRNQLGPSIQSTMGTSSATTLASGSHSSSSVRKQVGPTSMGSQQIQPPAGGGCANKSSSSSHPGPYLSSAVSNRGCSSASGQKTGSSGGRHACTEAGPNPGCVGGSDTSNKSAGSKNASTLTAAGGDHHASDAKQLGTGVNNREFRTSNSYNTVLADHSLGKDTHNS